MRHRSTRLAMLLVTAGIGIAPPATVCGQGLGGYGASTPGVDAGMGMGGGAIIPYGGSFGGFMPSRMGGTGSLSFRPLTRAEMAPVRPSFRLSPGPGGMSSMGSGGGSGLGGIGPAGGMGTMRGGNGPTGMGVMPPSFGYPFRQPPSLLGPASTGLGMSM